MAINCKDNSNEIKITCQVWQKYVTVLSTHIINLKSLTIVSRLIWL